MTEALNKQMGSRVLVVGAGQNALSTDTPQFAWLRDRYTIRVELSDADVETVTRKVLLDKKPEAIAPLKAELEKNSGEISRQLAKSSIASTSADQQWLVPDYPILPTRRRFWEIALHAVDPSGSSSLLRTQLRITHEALRDVADQKIGHVISGDFMFFQQQTALVQQGILSREVSDRIIKLKADGSRSGDLKARICGLVFLIRKFSRDKGMDSGIRANEEMLADLLVTDLAHDGAKVRHDLPAFLKDLVDASVLLHDGNEYNLQTKESAEWDDLFKVHVAKVRQDVATVAQERKARLRAGVDEVLRSLRLQQGVAKTTRDLLVHFGSEQPESSDQGVPVWVRDEWEVDGKQMQGKAREAGPDSPMLFVWLPKKQEDVLRESLIRMKASQAVLEIKGVPTTRPAEEARDAMQARRNDAERTVESILKEILAEAKAFKGGGVELHALELFDKVSDGAQDALKRLFPRFDEADQKGWEIAANRARQGDDSPLNAIGWKGATEDHSVCKEILHLVGAGKEGRHILAQLQRAPYGWDKDAVHGALVCLCAAGRLLAADARTGEALSAKQLDHQRIAKASFRTESVTLSAKDKIAIKGLFQSLGVTHARLMRKHQAWCPHCLEEGEVPYFRGVWDLELATACCQHGRQLLHTCTQCGARQRRYRCKGSVWHCQRCNHPLIANPTNRAQAPDISVARALGELVSEVTGQRLSLSGAQMKTAIFAWAESQGAKSGNAKARLLRIPQSLACYWSHPKRVPSLQRLLEVSLLNGLPLLEVCRGSISLELRSSGSSQVKRAWHFRLLSERKKKSLRKKLAEIASSPFPPCLQHVAKQLGVARGTLEALDSQLCGRLSKRSDDHRNITSAARFIHFRTRVDRCIEEAVQNGKPPTVKGVGDRLRHPGQLRSPKCREYIKAMVTKARRELIVS